MKIVWIHSPCLLSAVYIIVSTRVCTTKERSTPYHSWPSSSHEYIASQRFVGWKHHGQSSFCNITIILLGLALVCLIVYLQNCLCALFRGYLPVLEKGATLSKLCRVNFGDLINHRGPETGRKQYLDGNKKTWMDEVVHWKKNIHDISFWSSDWNHLPALSIKNTFSVEDYQNVCIYRSNEPSGCGSILPYLAWDSRKLWW